MQAKCSLFMPSVPVKLSLLMMYMEKDPLLSLVQGKTRHTRLGLASSCPVLILCRPEDRRHSTATSNSLLIRSSCG